jgi:hypothetical protein
MRTTNTKATYGYGTVIKQTETIRLNKGRGGRATKIERRLNDSMKPVSDLVRDRTQMDVDEIIHSLLGFTG